MKPSLGHVNVRLAGLRLTTNSYCFTLSKQLLDKPSVYTGNQLISSSVKFPSHFTVKSVYLKNRAETAPTFSGFTQNLTPKPWAARWTRATLTELSLSEDQFAALPEDLEPVLFLAPVISPYQQIQPFPDQLAQRVTRGMEGRLGRVCVHWETGIVPQGWSEILYACAFSRKVCGQLLKDFLWSQDYPESIRDTQESRFFLPLVHLNSA